MHKNIDTVIDSLFCFGLLSSVVAMMGSFFSDLISFASAIIALVSLTVGLFLMTSTNSKGNN